MRKILKESKTVCCGSHYYTIREVDELTADDKKRAGEVVTQASALKCIKLLRTWSTEEKKRVLISKLVKQYKHCGKQPKPDSYLAMYKDGPSFATHCIVRFLEENTDFFEDLFDGDVE